MKPNRLSRRDFLKLAVIGAAGASLAGCAPNAKSQENAAEPTKAPPAEAEPTKAPPAASKVKVTLITQESEIGVVESDAAKVFSEKSGIDAEVLQTTDYNAKITADFASGGGIYDAMIVGYGLAKGYAASGHLLALDDYIAAHPDLDIEDFIPAIYEAFGHWYGKHYSLPNNGDTYVRFYRKDIFEDPDVQAAFKSETGKDLALPDTVEDELVVARFLTKKLNPDSPIEYGWTNWSDKSGITWWYSMRLAALGSSWLDENLHPNFNNENGLRVLKDYITLHEFAPADVTTYEWTKSTGSYLDGTSAMTDNWNAVGAMVETPEGYWGASKVVGKNGYAVPSGYMVDGKVERRSLLGGWSANVSAYSKNPDAAFELIAYLTGKEVDPLKAATGNAAVRQSTYDNWVETPTTKHFPVVAQCFAIADLKTRIDAPPITSQLTDYLNNQMSRAILKELEPEQALQMVEDEWTKLLKDAGIYG